MNEVYHYAIDGREPLTSCPKCGANFLFPESVDLELVVHEKPIAARTALTRAGQLIDTPDRSVLRGFHSRTLCRTCGEDLCDYEVDGPPIPPGTDRWLHGECSQFAVALQKRFGGVIVARYEWSPDWWNENLDHAILVKYDRGYDVTGEIDLKAFYAGVGPQRTPGFSQLAAGPVSVDRLDRMVRDGCDIHDTADAEAYIGENFARFIGLGVPGVFTPSDWDGEVPRRDVPRTEPPAEKLPFSFRTLWFGFVAGLLVAAGIAMLKRLLN